MCSIYDCIYGICCVLAYVVISSLTDTKTAPAPCSAVNAPTRKFRTKTNARARASRRCCRSAAAARKMIDEFACIHLSAKTQSFRGDNNTSNIRSAIVPENIDTHSNRITRVRSLYALVLPHSVHAHTSMNKTHARQTELLRNTTRTQTRRYDDTTTEIRSDQKATLNCLNKPAASPRGLWAVLFLPTRACMLRDAHAHRALRAHERALRAA